MHSLVFALVGFFRSACGSRRDLVLEGLAFRQQISVLQRGVSRPAHRDRDRLLRIALSRLWSNWREALAVVKPETVVRWLGEGSVRIGGARAVEFPVGRVSIGRFRA